MKSRSLLLVLALASETLGHLVNKRGCNADNCARAITGTRFAPSAQAVHTADCSSFMIQTITPAAPTSYVTVTPTSYSVIGSNAKRTAALEVAKRDASVTASSPGSPVQIAARQETQNPSDVPLYASACSGAVRYSSACSCAGITQTTTYAPTPATVTSTVYAAASIIPVCDPSNDYGANYHGGTMDPAAGRQNLPVTSLSKQACCAACYAEDSGCLAWYIAGGCNIVYETTGSNMQTDYCPTGQYELTGAYVSPGGYGLGPCLFPA